MYPLVLNSSHDSTVQMCKAVFLTDQQAVVVLNRHCCLNRMRNRRVEDRVLDREELHNSDATRNVSVVM